jgi:hypothetical protein
VTGEPAGTGRTRSLARRRGRAWTAWPCLLVPLVCLAGCLPFSSFQSARIVPVHRSQGTLAVSWMEYGTTEDDRDRWTCLDGHVRVGLKPRIDAGFGLTILSLSGGEGLGCLLAADVRYGLLRGRLALSLPVTLIQNHLLQVTPGVVLTVPFGGRSDISATARRHLLSALPGHLLSGVPAVWSCDLGLGVPVPRSNSTLRPEVGWMFMGPGRRACRQVGIALKAPVR